MLLDRDTFKEQVFTRDKFKCVMCKDPAVDAHHLLDRSLWPDGGYYVDNGVALCSACHLKAEHSEILPHELRELAKIKTIILPSTFNEDILYDKWGMAKYYKYPRTYHLPFSPGADISDKVLDSADHFKGKEIVITEKMDGENTTLYDKYIHARSIDSKHHESRSWVKGFHAKISYLIPPGWRVCGENLFAEHSIRYTNLLSYFYGFSVWDHHNFCLDFEYTLEWFDTLGIISVPIIYHGVYNEKLIEEIIRTWDFTKKEGFVIRLAEGFHYNDFSKSMAKFVRANHVQTDEFWMDNWKPNKLREKNT